MCSPFSCGTSTFPAEEYDIDELLSPCKRSHTTKTTEKRKDKRRSKTNPYADRGRDKFNALLEELESKKQSIYTQKGSEDISFIRFVYSSSGGGGGEWKPVVVKGKVKNIIGSPISSSSEEASSPRHVVDSSPQPQHVVKVNKSNVRRSKSRTTTTSRSIFALENLRQPGFYLSMMLILVLLVLSISGKSFAILFTTIGWYILPLQIKEKNVELTRKLSERHVIKNQRPCSPTSVLDGPEGMSPLAVDAAAKHAHRKSW